ncbi:hypothetical protein [Acidisoma silvae]|uniref:Uncharacterized protein n=1 Tax=Acidisoma silvae TaxID=2802396 RepID=A0A963YWI6_9PROT|nr:hypothetical protein [Acidisoma silvae]MCB8877610.1 hypothetical protein [Acidisoma silvae]
MADRAYTTPRRLTATATGAETPPPRRSECLAHRTGEASLMTGLWLIDSLLLAAVFTPGVVTGLSASLVMSGGAI